MRSAILTESSDPRVIAIQFEQPRPRRVRFHRQRLFVRFKVNRSATPRIICERAPFRRNERRMIFVFARSDDARVLIQCKRNVGLEGEARAFENDFRDEFRHGSNTNILPQNKKSACLENFQARARHPRQEGAESQHGLDDFDQLFSGYPITISGDTNDDSISLQDEFVNESRHPSRFLGVCHFDPCPANIQRLMSFDS